MPAHSRVNDRRLALLGAGDHNAPARARGRPYDSCAALIGSVVADPLDCRDGHWAAGHFFEFLQVIKQAWAEEAFSGFQGEF